MQAGILLSSANSYHVLSILYLLSDKEGSYAAEERTGTVRLGPLSASAEHGRQTRCQNGLIERITDPNDRRKTLVRPTEKGLDASRQVEAAISRYFERVICRIPEEQREQLFSLTGVLLEAVEAENAEQQAKLKGENENG